ncbi:MAG: hypothetical protein K1X75_04355 [Leptospirales bacterium]|nr:hypothetical protein [Leptospirales bacterium]
MSTSVVSEEKLKFRMPGRLQTICLALIGVGLALTVVLALGLAPHWTLGGEHAASEHAAEHGATAAEHSGGEHEAGAWNPRFFFAIHLAALVAIPLGLGGIFFVAVNHLAGAAWNVTVRRVAENYWWFLPVPLLLIAIVLFGGGMDSVFSHWVHAPATDELIQKKSWWLNRPTFELRNVIIVLLWILFGFLFWKQSTSQDADGRISRTRLMAKLGGGFLVFFGLSYSISGWDLSMSTYPHWFSTIWAVYIFAGMALTLYASLVLWVWYLKKNGYYGDALNENHFHDLGKFMFGHTIFWTYIAVSQYMLIYYGHIPEETVWYQYRLTGGWYYVTLLLVLTRFVAPFFLLVRREPKRDYNYMKRVAILVLFGQVLDMFWILYPVLHHDGGVPVLLAELGPLLIVGGSFVLIIGKMLERHALIPQKDPRLEECLHFHQ